MALAQKSLDMGNSVEIDWEQGTVTAERKLRSSGNSTVLTIPEEVYQSIGLCEGQQVEIVADKNEDVIRIRSAEEGASGE
ncbi:AbrB/MazE/SpoVT family DNA-binding domain-containing protein [Natrarchaeobaculum sulfurireducens]|uniref:AbrB/MazE/SpoVT family DNA-binding domain-containing protein n=1 Tax=Natrarchaeobaculum sulfurireducens TaxID=2044521 RepID=A0A346PHH8_9EURY|nr:hypothetical protein [Natrarchaeobaculum sulfurireducens]AXR78973.1 hypothetical protein AArc1_2660 [Natrarchaeobaculum sulfurireducens]